MKSDTFYNGLLEPLEKTARDEYLKIKSKCETVDELEKELESYIYGFKITPDLFYIRKYFEYKFDEFFKEEMKSTYIKGA